MSGRDQPRVSVLAGVIDQDETASAKLLSDATARWALVQFEVPDSLYVGAELERLSVIDDLNCGRNPLRLTEIAGAHEKRGNLYKTISEIESDPWYEKVFRKMAFPLGLTVGAYLGVKIADNN